MKDGINWSIDKDLYENLLIPIKIEKYNSYLDELNKRFQDYQKYIDSFLSKNKGFDKDILNSIKNTSDLILECINLYHKGKAGQAYNCLEELLNSLSDDLYISQLESDEHLFRMRLSSEPLFENTDMFHIPFSKRHLVESRRYSIAGVPCLYLGNSHFICWYELNKPNFHNLYTSSFKTLQSIYLLDLTKELTYIEKCSNSDEIKSFFKFYPLTISCNVKTKFLDAKFNNEYIISNLLLQWVLENDQIDGIKFISVKYFCDDYREKLYNYVLPPKTINGEYCPELAERFEVTNPSQFAILMYGPNPSEVTAFQQINGIDAESALLNIYDETIFGRTEIITKSLPHYSISQMNKK